MKQFDAAEIERSIGILYREGDIIEVRVPNTEKSGTISGYFDDREALVKAICGVAPGNHPGIYWTLNPARQDLLARAANRLKIRAPHTTKDTDVSQICWLLTDIDPIRPAGVSSTREELQAAIDKAYQIKEFLSGRGWPAPVLAGSGNGAHLLHRMPDLPNSTETAELLRGCLQALSLRFSDDIVHIDTSTYNASRVAKVYGTRACKGDSIESRPHRLAHLLDVPESRTAVDVALIRELAAEVKPRPQRSVEVVAPGNGELPSGGNEQAMERWIRAHGLDISRGPEHRDGSTKWILKRCPFDPQHGGTSAALFLSEEGRPGFRCLHTSCADRHFVHLSEHLGEPLLSLSAFHLSCVQSSLNGNPPPTNGGGDRERGPLPEIKVNDRQLRHLRADCVAALNEANNPPSLYLRGGIPVHIVADETQTLSIKPITPEVMRNFLTDTADFVSYSDSGRANVRPPMDAVKAVLASSSSSLKFPALEGIIQAPSLRPDGSVIHTPGYDPLTRLYYNPAPDLHVPEIPDQPTPDHVAVAVDQLQDLLDQFPFADAASKAHILAAMVTLVLRAGITGSIPVLLIDASAAGSGKSLLANSISVIATGAPAPMFSMPGDSEEWRKLLTSVVMAGLPYAVIDNLNARLESGQFCKVITERRHADRILGVSELVDMPAQTMWAATGNNIQVGGDMPRRGYWSRLEPGCSDPFLRTGFKYPLLLEHARSRRGELIAGILCMARAWFVAGQPAPRIRPLGGFERWTVMIGGILQYAGVEGFLGNAQALYDDADDEAREWEVFFRLLRRVFSEDFAVNQIWDRLRQPEERDADVRPSELRAAVPSSVKEFLDRGENTFNRRLGSKFRELLGRRFGPAEIRLERVADDKHSKVARWRLVAKGDVDMPPRSK
jgi:hypothetical protein